jgi:hypothetical protein
VIHRVDHTLRFTVTRPRSVVLDGASLDELTTRREPPEAA